MSSHGGHSGTGSGFSNVVPVELETANALSWMLGERVTREDDRATLVARWEHDASPRRVAVYEVTAETAVLRHRSPAGRERYVGTTKAEANQACADLDASAEWHRAGK